MTCIDLTTLSGDDTETNVERLCFKAKAPVREDIVTHYGMQGKKLTTGAVCVYPNRVKDAAKYLAGTGIPIASVAAGFPAGQTPLPLRLAEIKQAVADGATEIDIVISREYVLGANWQALYDEIRQMREACGEAKLKSILATGECGTLTNVYKASLVAMMAGSDTIKTSTGKEGVNATYPVALTMLRAIRDYKEKTGFYVRCPVNNKKKRKERE